MEKEKFRDGFKYSFNQKELIKIQEYCISNNLNIDEITGQPELMCDIINEMKMEKNDF